MFEPVEILDTKIEGGSLCLLAAEVRRSPRDAAMARWLRVDQVDNYLRKMALDFYLGKMELQRRIARYRAQHIRLSTTLAPCACVFQKKVLFEMYSPARPWPPTVPVIWNGLAEFMER